MCFVMQSIEARIRDSPGVGVHSQRTGRAKVYTDPVVACRQFGARVCPSALTAVAIRFVSPDRFSSLP